MKKVITIKNENPEPLKNKGNCCHGKSMIECYDDEKFYHLDEDIKSAVEGCQKELTEETFESFPPSTKDNIKKTFKKWFEDVI